MSFKMNATKINFDEIQGYIQKFNDLKNLAEKYKETPAAFLDFIIKVGNEVLIRTNDNLIDELNENLKTFVKIRKINLTDKPLQDLFNFLENFKSIAESRNKKND